ncbi:MAG: hypothetical protein HZB38_15535 [Planctomycetes bacterium]|nr:hypothetical protein [Planctomycetota bacterium]
MSLPNLDADADLALKKVSQEIAREFDLEFVGTEHVLLAVLRLNRGIGATVLKNAGITEDKARLEVERVVEKDMEDTWVFGRLPGSPHYRNVVAFAIDEATQLESKTIGTEHLLLALMREESSTASRVLARLGITLKGCRAAVLKLL